MKAVWAQIIGGLAIITITSSVHFKKKNHMMTMQSLAHLLFAIQYIVLDAFSAAYMDTIAIVRNLIFYKFDETKRRIPIILPIIICIIICIIGYINYNGIITLLPVIIALAYTISASFKDPKVYKYTFGVCILGWMYYNLHYGAYVCVIGNIVELVSTITAVIRDLKRKKKYFF
jgi:hypothetical protein